MNSHAALEFARSNACGSQCVVHKLILLRATISADKTPRWHYNGRVSASEIIKELSKLSEAERRAILNKLRELAGQDEDVRVCEQAASEQAVELDRVEERSPNYRAVDLRSRGISEAQADDLRGRLKTFAEDWDRPEAAIYDEDPPR